MTSLIRSTRRIVVLLLKIAGLLALLAVLAVLTIGFTPFGTRLVAGKVADLVSKPGQTVAIATPSGLLTGALRVPEITLSDRNGVYARIENLAIDWSPTTLLSLTFRAQSISAERVEVLRPPLPAEQAAPASDAPFRLPVKLDIARIALPDIEIGKAVAGREFQLTAEGSGSADMENIVAKLAVARKDSPEAKAGADIAFVPGENRLTLSAALDEPRDGMLAGLLDLPGRPAMHLTVEGAGPLSDWKGDLTATLDGNRAFTATARHQAVADNGHRIELTGTGQAQPLMPATVRDLFAGNTDFAFDATLGSAGKVTVKTGTLSTGSVRLSLAGTYDPNGGNDLTGHVEGANGPVKLVIPAAGKTASVTVSSLDLTLKGPADHAALAVNGLAPDLDYPGYRLSGVRLSATSDGLNLRTRTGPALVNLTFDTAAFADPNLQRLLPGPFSLKAPLTLSPSAIHFDQAEIESARLGGTLTGAYDLEAATGNASVKLFALPAALPDALGAKLKGNLALAGNLSYGGNGIFSVSGLSVGSSLVTLTGEAGLSGGALRADLKGNLPDLSALLGDARGAADFTLSASGSPAAPDFDATLSSKKAVLSGRTLENLAVSAKGKADSKAPQAQVTATGSLSGQSVSVNAALQTAADGIIRLPQLKADIGPNHLEGNLDFSAAFMPDGNLRFDLPDIGLVAALAGEKASGDIKGEARFTRNGATASAKITAEGKSLQRDALVIRNPRVSLDVADIRSLAAKGTVTALEIASGANRVQQLTLAFDRNGAETRFDLKAGYDGKPALAKGGVTVAGGRTTVNLASASAAPRGIPLRLANPATITIDKGVTTLSALVIEAGKGRVAITGTAGNTLDIKADIRDMPVSLANTVMPQLKADGTLSGTVNVSGKPASPAVAYTLTLDRAAIDQTRSAGLQPLGIKASGRFETGQLRLDATTSNADGLQLKGGGTVAVSGNKALNLAFTGSVPFKAAAAMLAKQGLEVSGTASLDIKVSGTSAAPVVTGRISSGDARLVDVRHNIAIKNLALAINLDRTRATIDKLSGTLSTGGTVAVTGSVGIQPGSNFPADLKIALNKAAYVDGKVVSTVIDGNLTLTGPLLANPKLGGNLALGRSAITIPQKLPASLSSINVKHRNESKAVAVQTADVMSRDGSGKGSSSQIGLALTISAPRIFVQGRGIDAELGGDLTLNGTANAPVVSGGFKMKRGRMTILSRRLDFTSGTITFGGDLTPTLAMAAEGSAGSATVTVNIDGPANDPAITFSSSPTLPQDEILAQLIFQQSLSRLSVLQIAQLADAAAQLAGGRSTSLLQGLRSNLGIDDLDITSDANGQAQVKAGKYLNDRTYIQVEQGAGSGSKASINLDVGRGVKLKGEAGTDGGSAAGIFYEKEY